MPKNQRVADDSQDKKYFILTPQIVWAECSDPYEYTLWNVVKMVASENGECFLSTEDLAALAMMSMGKVSTCRKSLIEKGLLKGELYKEVDYPQPVWHLSVPDLWAKNIAWRIPYDSLKERIRLKLDQKEVKKPSKKSLHTVKASPGEEGIPPNEEGIPPRETKKNQKKNHKEEPAALPVFGPLTMAIAGICQINIEYLTRDTGKELVRLGNLFDKNHVTPAQVKEFEGWRRIHHWSGKTAPTVKQVGELWGQYEAWVKVGKPGLDAAKNGIPTPPTKPAIDTEEYKRLRAESQVQIHNPLGG